MSGHVAQALKLLGKDVERSPQAKRGRKGRPDSEVARAALGDERIVFTNNFDMVVAAVEHNTRVLWFYDAKHNSPTRYKTARLFFNRWESWEERFSPPDVYCLRVSMGRTTPISKEAARRQASALDRKSKRQKRRRPAPPGPGQTKLTFAD